ncbi:MAG: isoprenylcysteine carboxylmethyltransferase family protein [Thermodesulfovibrionales bacterium]
MITVLFDHLALAVVIIWPVIPLFWIPVHGFSKVFRKLGLLTYFVPVVTWTPLAVFLFSQREFILRYKTGFPPLVVFFGVVLLFLGSALQVWTARLLSLKGLMGMPEVSAKVESRFVTTGPYRVVRHPTYLAHTLMFSGLFLISGVIAMGFVTLLDLLLINFVVIPLEDRELSARFGPAYDEYRRKVAGFFPFHS